MALQFFSAMFVCVRVGELGVEQADACPSIAGNAQSIQGTAAAPAAAAASAVAFTAALVEVVAARDHSGNACCAEVEVGCVLVQEEDFK